MLVVEFSCLVFKVFVVGRELSVVGRQLHVQDLFNAAFVTVWDELFIEASEAPVVDAVQSALASSSLPSEILNQLLNLASFMELQDKV